MVIHSTVIKVILTFLFGSIYVGYGLWVYRKAKEIFPGKIFPFEKYCLAIGWPVYYTKIAILLLIREIGHSNIRS